VAQPEAAREAADRARALGEVGKATEIRAAVLAVTVVRAVAVLAAVAAREAREARARLSVPVISNSTGKALEFRTEGYADDTCAWLRPCSTSRIFAARSSGLNDFSMKATPGSRTPMLTA
jgi:hypothetical protein